MDPIRELPYRPAACDGRIVEAGNTSAPDHALHSPSRFFLHQWGRPNTFVMLHCRGAISPGGDVGLQVDLGFNKAALLGMIAINVLD